MRFPIDIETDVTVTALSLHDVTPPVGPPIKGAPCIEFPAEQGNAPGSVTHKLTRMVRHRHKRIVQKGHNVGGFILHISVPPLNVMTPAQVIGSARKILVTSRANKVEGAEAAMALVMSNCSDPCDLPGTVSSTSSTNSLYINIDLTDIVRAIARYLMGVAVKLGVSILLAKPASTSLPSGATPDMAAQIKVFERLIGAPLSADSVKSKILTDILAGAAGLWIEEELDADRPATAIRFTSPLVGVGGAAVDGYDAGVFVEPSIIDRVEQRYADDLAYFATVEGAEPTVRLRGSGGVPSFEIVDGRDDS